MRLLITTFLFFSFTTSFLSAQEKLNYFMPEGVTYDPKIPTPKEILGYEVGEWHISHDQLVNYMYRMADASDRIKIEEIGRTYEHRPQLQLTITSPSNHAKLESIRQEHIKLADPEVSKGLNIDNMPVVVHLGYSIHGNEASGTNSSILVVYYLAAAQSDYIDRLLENEVILLDPSFNPDGMNRFAHWVNSNRGIRVINNTGDTREHNEVWPGGRTNHYWFDLNRDWLPAQHPESQNRLKRFHYWKYNFQTDHHEMGTNSTFFFQPGVPSRNHPLIPARTVSLSNEMANYFSAALDSIGSLYYSKEGYDDFYFGKGSTYPDVNGAVGILFEQGSSRGHAQKSDNGLLTFPFAIKNHFNASLATLKGTLALRKELLKHQQTFYQSANSQADKDPIKGYVFSLEKDKARLHAVKEMLLRHDIKIYELDKDLTANGKNFKQNSSVILPLRQKQYHLIKAMFEKRTSFEDSLFYDISAWTFPLSFGLDYSELDKGNFTKSLLGTEITEANKYEGKLIGGETNYAYVFEWHEYFAPRALNRIFEAGLRAKVATKPFSIPNGKSFDYGSILIPVKGQDLSSSEIKNLMETINQKDGIDIHGMKSGFTNGINLGSNSFRRLEQPKIAIISDGGVSGYEVGEVWHLLDYRYSTDLTLIPTHNFSKVDLSKYNTLIMVNGSYTKLNRDDHKIRDWVSAGGVLITTKKATQWAASKKLGIARMIKGKKPELKDNLLYKDKRNISGAQVTGGAIFKANIDLTHPIGYGYTNSEIALFRNSTLLMEKASSPFNNPVYYSDSPLLSGYVSNPNLEKLRNTGAVVVSKVGKGRVISMTDNPNFRAFWYGTNKLFMNAIWFGRIIN